MYLVLARNMTGDSWIKIRLRQGEDMIDGETYNRHLKMLAVIQIKVPATTITISLHRNLKRTTRKKITELIVILFHQVITSILKGRIRVTSEF
jgi:hypothetical protein